MAWNTIVTDLSALMAVPADAAEKVSFLTKKASCKEEESENSTLKLVIRCAAAVVLVAAVAVAVVGIVKAVKDLLECVGDMDDFDEDDIAPDVDEDEEAEDSDDDQEDA